MPGSKTLVQIQTLEGQPFEAGPLRVTPESRVLIVRLPFGGLVWHRPTALAIEQDGTLRRLPIVDLTRAAQLSLVAGTGLLIAVCVIASARQ